VTAVEDGERAHGPRGGVRRVGPSLASPHPARHAFPPRRDDSGRDCRPLRLQLADDLPPPTNSRGGRIGAGGGAETGGRLCPRSAPARGRNEVAESILAESMKLRMEKR